MRRIPGHECHGFFVTGTDTGVGKTLISCALLHAFAAMGRSVIGMKPVAAGADLCNAGLVNGDALKLQAASNVEASLTLVNPYCFRPPIAPHIAAAQIGEVIDLARIAQAYAQLAAIADVVIVEGVGGFCVPLNDLEDAADLSWRLNLPVILVVGIRLGCLNHALLTAQAIRQRGLVVAGWVANHMDSEMEAAADNVNALVSRLQSPLLAEIEFTLSPDPHLVAARLELPRLR